MRGGGVPGGGGGGDGAGASVLNEEKPRAKCRPTIACMMCIHRAV